MNISRVLFGALVLCALPALAQPDIKPANGLPYPLVSPEEAGRLATPFSIKLHLRDATIGEAFAEVQKQTGVVVDTSSTQWNVMSQKFSFDIETASLQDAAKAIFKTANAKLKLQKSDWPGWVVVPEQGAGKQGAPVSGTPPLELRILGVSSSQSATMSFGKTPKREQSDALTLDMRYEVAPQSVLVGAPELQVARAEDDRGRSLRFEDKDLFRFMGMRTMGNHISLRLLSPTRGSQKIAHLEGKALCVLVAKRHRWEVPDVLQAKNVSHEFIVAGQKTQVVIEDAQRVGETVRLHLLVRSAFDTQFDERRNPLMNVQQLSRFVYLIDANGHSLGTGNFGSTGGNGEMRMEATFSLPKPPSPSFMVRDGKAVAAPQPAPIVLTGPFEIALDVPIEFVQTEVPFSFSDLPLP